MSRLPLLHLVALLASALCNRAAAQRIHTTQVLLRRDLDGDGKLDSIVIESKRGPIPSMPPARAAVYLSSSTRRGPSYAMPWDEETGSDTRVDRVVAAGAHASLVVLNGAGADNVFLVVLRVRDGKVTEIASHDIDYGEGDFALLGEGTHVTLRVAPPEHVRVVGAAPLTAIRCAPNRVAEAIMTYEVSTGRFGAARQQCVPRPVE